MNVSLFITILAVLQIVCFWVGKRASQGVSNENDYFLAGRDVRFFPLLMTFVATQIGGGLILGAAEEAYRFGWTVILYPLGACLGFVLLASGVGKRLAQFNVSTVAQLFEVVYASKLLKYVASILSIVSLFMILIAQVIASKKFMLSLGVNQEAVFIGFWIVVIIYTVMGGLKAVVSIDIVQALFFIGVFALGFGYILYANSLPISTLFSVDMSNEVFDFDVSKLTGWLLMPLLFMVIEQDMAQRCFAAKSPKVVTQAAATAAIITLLISLIPIFIGITGKVAGLTSVNGSSIFMDVVQAMTSPQIAAFVGCAVLMAVISTAISLINAVSSNLSQDFDFNTSSTATSENDLRRSKLMTGFIGGFALGVSYYAGEIVGLLIQSYELSVSCLFIPVLMALFKKKGNTQSAWIAILCGAVGFCFFRWQPIGIPREILSLGLSAIGFGLGELMVFLRSSPRLQSELEKT